MRIKQPAGSAANPRLCSGRPSSVASKFKLDGDASNCSIAESNTPLIYPFFPPFFLFQQSTLYWQDWNDYNPSRRVRFSEKRRGSRVRLHYSPLIKYICTPTISWPLLEINSNKKLSCVSEIKSDAYPYTGISSYMYAEKMAMQVDRGGSVRTRWYLPALLH